MAPRPTVDKLLDDKIARAVVPPATGSKITYDGGAKAVRGFGVRVTAAGAKAFILNYRVHGIERRLTIGSFPTWSTIAARKEAQRLRREIDQGHDPLGERVAVREAPTMADLCGRYLAEYAAARKRERSRLEDESLIKQWIGGELGNRKVADIRRADIDRLHRKITETGTPVRANRAVTLLSKMFTLAMRWDLRTDNPASGIDRNPEEPRHRYLSGDELRRLTDALAASTNQQAANAIRLLLLTGARRGEVLGATWTQFDLDTGVWVRPSAHTKQKREHRAPISEPARLLLVEMKSEAEQSAKQKRRLPSPYLFPSRTGDGPMVELKSAWVAICTAAGFSDVRLHDLRHTFASVLAGGGVSLPIIGALLGHTQPGTTNRYAHLADDPLRAATERVGAAVAGATAASAEKVVPLRPAS
jgi:integrase